MWGFTIPILLGVSVSGTNRSVGTLWALTCMPSPRFRPITLRLVQAFVADVLGSSLFKTPPNAEFGFLEEHGEYHFHNLDHPIAGSSFAAAIITETGMNLNLYIVQRVLRVCI